MTSPLHGRRRTWAAAAAAIVASALVLQACQHSRVAKQQSAPQAPAPRQPVRPVDPAPGTSVESTIPDMAVGAAAGAAVRPADVDLTAPDGEIRVALLLPLTGRHARLGEAMLNAAQLALFDIADDRFALVVRDTGGTPRGAQAATGAAVGQGAGLILGPIFSTSVQAMAPEARRAGVNVLTFSNDAAIAGDGVFVMGLDPRSQIDRVVSYGSRRGMRRYAILAPSGAYGNTVMAALRESVARTGGQVVRGASYNPAAGDASAEVRSLAQYDSRRQRLIAEKQRLAGRADAASRQALRGLQGRDTSGPPDYDALMLPVAGKDLLALAPLFPFYDVDPQEVRFLGTALWDDPQLGSEPALVGAWFAAPPPALWGDFKQRYSATYGKIPPRLASLAYDATALAAVLAGRAVASGRPRAFDRGSITQPSGFSGVDGLFRFLPTGRSQRGLAVLEVQRGGSRILDPAPRAFEDLAF